MKPWMQHCPCPLTKKQADLDAYVRPWDLCPTTDSSTRFLAFCWLNRPNPNLPGGKAHFVQEPSSSGVDHQLPPETSNQE